MLFIEKIKLRFQLLWHRIVGLFYAIRINYLRTQIEYLEERFDVLEYPPCKKCGAIHEMGIEDMERGIITPIDVCSKCLFQSPNYTKTPIVFEEVDE